jgi:hypothetical protein
MALAPFNIALQVIAAVVIFIFGYVALFVSLIICLAVCVAIGSGIYRAGAYAVRSARAKTFISSDVALICGLDSAGQLQLEGRS